MSYFVLTFSRRANGEPQIERFEDIDEATGRLAVVEASLRADDPSREVVLLVADSLETLRTTHAHYFATADEILARAR